MQLPPEVLGAFINAGVAGLVLLWFMLRMEKRIELLERAIDRLARAQMLTLVAFPDIQDQVRTLAHEVLDEAEAAKVRRDIRPRV